MAFSLSSPKIQNQAEIPIEYTREGKNLSPPLEWNEAPPETKSFVLVCEDPDAPDPAHPQRTFVHWVVYNIPSNMTSLPENVRKLPTGVYMGTNDWGQTSYGGPAPPIGRHRYFFRLYALDTMLSDQSGLTRSKLDRKMQGHILATAELVGTYESVKRRAA